MIPRFRPSITAGDLRTFFTPGSDELSLLEIHFAKLYGYHRAVWFPYARVAVQCFLEGTGVRHRQVALSPFNCSAIGHAVVRSGAVPLYVDTETKGFNQNLEQFESALREDSVATGILVSLWGIPAGCDGSRFRFSKPILHDYALRGLDFARPHLGDGDGAVYSLGWGKPVSGLRGGMLCSDDVEQADKWRSWRASFLLPPRSLADFKLAASLYAAFLPGVFGAVAFANKNFGWGRKLSGNHSVGEDVFPFDWNRKISSPLIRLAVSQLNQTEDLAGRRASQIKKFVELMAPSVSSIDLPPPVPWLSHFPVRTMQKAALHRFLARSGIFSSDRLFDRLLCDYPQLAGKVFQPLTNATILTKTTLHLPLFHQLSDAQIEMIATRLNQFTSKSVSWSKSYAF